VRNSECSEADLDLDQFLYDKKSNLDHFFRKVHDELSSQSIFSLHFFLKYSKHLAKKGAGADEQSLELLRNALNHVSADDIEEFLFYETEVAVQIVNDLVDSDVQRSKLNKIDREMKNLAQKIKTCANWRQVRKMNPLSQSLSAQGNSNGATASMRAKGLYLGMAFEQNKSFEEEKSIVNAV